MVNPIYMFTILAFNCDVLMFGYIVFIPKFLEVQFHMETTTANMLGGAYIYIYVYFYDIINS